MAKRSKPGRASGKTQRPGPRRTKAVADRVVRLSVAEADPQQPAGLPPAEPPSAKVARAAALKSAHARFMNRPKPQK